MPEQKAPPKSDKALAQPERTPCIPEPELCPDETRFHTLCSVCDGIFSRVHRKEAQYSMVSRFHNLAELTISAADGCHFCNLIIADMRSRKTYSLPAGESSQTMAETNALEAILHCFIERTGRISVWFWLREAGIADPANLADIDLASADKSFDTQATTLSFDTQSESTWNQILCWNKQCLSSHHACKPTSASIPKKDYPGRLLYVGSTTSPVVQVCETSGMEELTSYTTLSHCWGHHVPLRLLVENYSSFLEEIQLCDLPKTFRDAIHATRKLGVSFLWIDSLCIIQDSPEDWSIESSKMGQIYRNSYLNLAAVASKDSTGGLYFQRSPLQVAPCGVQVCRDTCRKFLRSKYYSGEVPSRGKVLYSRAWVFQEWLLAPRALLFGDTELVWECGELSASEVYPKGRSKMTNRRGPADIRNEWQNLRDKGSKELWRLWWQVVEQYSELHLTRFSDKLVAVSGLASEMARIWDGVDYLAGIWSFRIRRNLLWHCYFSVHFDPRPVYTAPSWSWASITQPVRLDFGCDLVDGLAEVLDASVQHSTPSNPRDAVPKDYIKIKGPMVKAKISEGILARGEEEDEWIIDFDPEWKQNSEEALIDGSEDDIGGSFRDDPSDEDYDEWEEEEEALDDEDQDELLKIPGTVTFDHPVTDKLTEDTVVYLAPLEITNLPGHQGLDLQGLVLLPTKRHPGQFRRLGVFQVRDIWYDLDHDLDHDWEAMTRNPVTESQNGGSQVNSGGLDDDTRPIAGLKKYWHGQCDPREARELLSNFSRIATRDDAILEMDRPRKDDPYCNGPMKFSLLDRYGLDTAKAFPNIRDFLFHTWDQAQRTTDNEDDDSREDLFEENHGGGYYTYSIV